MPARLFAALALLAALAACAAPAPPPVARPPAGTAAIFLSSGTSEWGFSATEIYADDTVIGVNSNGIGQPATERAQTVPGAYARVAAVLRRDGPAAVRATGGNVEICPGSRDGIAAIPPVGRFERLSAPCGGNTAPFSALYSAALAAIAPR